MLYLVISTGVVSLVYPGMCKEGEGFESNTFFCEPKRLASFLPFGYGKRACVGEKFATLGISALIATLLQNYEVVIHIVFFSLLHVFDVHTSAHLHVF